MLRKLLLAFPFVALLIPAGPIALFDVAHATNGGRSSAAPPIGPPTKDFPRTPSVPLQGAEPLIGFTTKEFSRSPSIPLQFARGEWSAFATDGKGNWGYGTFWANKRVAEGLAVNGCGGRGIGCKLFWTTNRHSCVAYAESRAGGYWYAAAGGDDRLDAKVRALRFCQSGNAPPVSCSTVANICRRDIR